MILGGDERIREDDGQRAPVAIAGSFAIVLALTATTGVCGCYRSGALSSEVEAADGSSGNTDEDVGSETEPPDTESQWGTETETETGSDSEEGCFVGDIVLVEDSDFAELDEYTCITGTVRVETQYVGFEVNNLVWIGESLIIADCDNLASPVFGSLEWIGDRLYVKQNEALPDMSGFQSLEWVGGDVDFLYNHYMGGLFGLEQLQDVGGSLRIQMNYELGSLVGLDNLISVGGSLRIFHNPLVGAQFGGLGNLESVGENLIVEDNDSLQNLEGLEGIHYLGGDLTIFDNDELEDVSGLENLLEVHERVTIERNAVLPTLAGLTSLSTVGGGLVVENNPSLPQCDACELYFQLESLNGYMNIEDNMEDACNEDCD